MYDSQMMQELLYKAAGTGVSVDSRYRSLYIADSRYRSHYIRLWVHESLQTADVGISIHV